MTSRAAPTEIGDRRNLRVLLFSPVRDRDPLSGDVSYTEALLADPPHGIVYRTYDAALKDGTLKIRGRRPRRGRTDPIDILVFGARAAELLGRRCGLMYREPTWFVTIDPDAFDVVHQHLFAVRQLGSRVPTVSSAGYPLWVHYAHQENWSSGRLRRATCLESRYDALLDVHNPWLRCQRTGLMTVYTDHFRDHLVASGIPAEKVHVRGTAIPDIPVAPKRTSGRTIGFIGRDFQRKGGDIAATAFSRLRESDPSLRFRVITAASAVPDDLRNGPGVEVFTDVSHESVLNDHIPEIDVLVLPTRSDCGAPFGVLEAMRGGACVVTSDSPWLDERLVGPGVIRAASTVDAVEDAVAELLEPSHLAIGQRAARELWLREFSTKALHEKLRYSYETALALAQS